MGGAGVTVVVDEGGIAKRFSIKVRDESMFALYSPFFVCLSSGALDSETFLRCISQDVHVLKAYARAYASFITLLSFFSFKRTLYLHTYAYTYLIEGVFALYVRLL